MKRVLVSIMASFFLFACDSQKISSKTKEETATHFKTYLEYSGSTNESTKANQFWEINLQEKSIHIKSGVVGTEGESTKKDYISEAIARYEAFKAIIEMREKGYKSPNRVSMATLLTYDKAQAKDIDKTLYSSLRGNHYKTFILIKGDIALDTLDIDAFHSKVDGLIVDGNLIVDGGIYNTEGDYGPALVVTGNVQADYLIGGGSEISLEGESYIHSFILGHYNHGILSTHSATAMIDISDDHHSDTYGKFHYDYTLNPNGGDEDLKALKYSLGSESAFFSDDYFNSDKFITAIQEKKGALKWLWQVLDANHADNPQLVSVIKNGLEIKEIENPNEEIQLAAVEQNGMALEYIPSASKAVQVAAVTQDANALKYIKSPSEEVQLAAVEHASWALTYLKNPTEKVIKHAVVNDGDSIEHIKNPSEELKILAVSNRGLSLEYIKNPSDAVQLAAVKQDGDAIQYIINKPSEKIKLAAVTQTGSAIKFIKNPSDEVKLSAVQNAGWVIEYINNPSEELFIAAVTDDHNAIESIKNPSEAVQLIVIKENSFNISDIKKPTEKIQLIAVSDIGEAIEYIKNPSEAVQLAAIRQAPRAIKYIEKPTDKVKKLAASLAQ